MPAGSPERAFRDDVKRIFALALEREPRERAEYLKQICGAQTELFIEVSSLLQSDRGLDSFFEKPPAGELSLAEDPMIGRRVGAYKILRQIGSGGMGAVYMAERADDQFRKRVALKAIKPGLIDEHALRRFQNERQTLAVLDHPNIIRLLDGGNTEQGSPWLVMEYVEGQPIDRYCAARRLPARDKLALMRTVLGAVHYAHQNLIVHRDLKPNNILVTAEGVPKLLDFGIAKLIRPEYLANSIGLTRTEMQPMTPEYASPEQVLGHPITTASDIYSLGVVLYRLLTGCHPYESKTGNAFELERAICETEPEKPSRFAARSHSAAASDAGLLRGDVDAIALMAMSKEPQRRYASAEHFAEDIRRHLEGRPVLARKSNVWYRTSKFVARNRMSVAGAALLTAALIASGWTAFNEKRAAERRFHDLRDFANWVLTDLDEKLREGQTPARKALAQKSLGYLDGLAREKGDRSIQLELVNGYIRNGDALGDLYGASLGETDGAEDSYRRALAIAEDLLRASPVDIEGQRAVVWANIKLGQVLAASGNRLEALRHYEDALRVNTALQAVQPSDLAALLNMRKIWGLIGSYHALLSDPEGALQSYRMALTTVERLPASYARKEYNVAFEREMVASFKALCGDAAGAEDTILESIATYRRYFDATPGPDIQRNIAKGYKDLAEVRNRIGKTAEALTAIRLSRKITEEMLARDPRDNQFQIDLQQALFMEIRLLVARGQNAEAETATKRALTMMKSLADKPGAPYQHASDYAELLSTTPFSPLRDDAAALKYAEKAVALTHETDPDVLHVLALAWERNGDSRQAIETDEKALAALPPPQAGRPPTQLRRNLETELSRLASPPTAHP